MTAAERRSCAAVDDVRPAAPSSAARPPSRSWTAPARLRQPRLRGVAPRPCEAVAARVTEVLPLYASVHRGAGYLSQVTTALYETARRTIARVRRRPSRRRRDHHAQHHRLAEPAGRACVPATSRAACSCSTSSTTPTCCPGCSQRRARPPRRSCRRRARSPRPSRSCGRAAAPAVRAPRRHRRLQRDRASRSRSTRSSRSPTPRAPGSCSTAPSSCRTAGSRWRRPASTTSPSPGTRPTRRSARAPWSGRRDWLDAGTPYLAGGGAVRDVRAGRHRLAAGARPARGRLAQRDRRRSRWRRRATSSRRSTRPARCTPTRTRSAAARGGAGGDRRRRGRARVAGLRRPRRRRDLHRARLRPRPGRRLPVRRARHRRAGRPLLRAPAARPPRLAAGAIRASVGVGTAERGGRAPDRRPHAVLADGPARPATRSSTAAGRSSTTPARWSRCTAWTTWPPRPRRRAAQPCDD